MSSVPDQLFAELLGRLDEDPEFDQEAFLATHPEHADELRRRVLHARELGVLPPTESGVLRRIRQRFGISNRVRLPTPPGDGDADLTIGPAAGPSLFESRYRLQAEIQHAGMSQVLLAEDVDLHREVVLKVVRLPEEEDGATHGSPGVPGTSTRVARFLREAQVTGQLDHPNIVAVHHLGLTPDDRLFFAMKRVRGKTLLAIAEALNRGELLAHRSYPVVEQVRVVLRISNALAHAHSRGVVHRDLKPSNVMVGSFGEIQVMDWGLAKVLRSDEEDLPGLSRGTADAASWIRTEDGDVFGTPSYMAPEQAAGRQGEVDERTDVFGLGAVLCHLVGGRPPYWAEGEEEVGDARRKVLARAQEGRLNDPTCRGSFRPVPRELAEVLKKAMAADRELRYRSVEEFARDLSAYLEGRPGSAWRDPLPARLTKAVRRHPTAATAWASTFLLALSLLVAWSLYGSMREEQAAREHEASRMRYATLAEELPRLRRRTEAVDAFGVVRPGELPPLYFQAFARAGIRLKESTDDEVCRFVLRAGGFSEDTHRNIIMALRHFALDLGLAGFAHAAMHLDGRGLAHLERQHQEQVRRLAVEQPDLAHMWRRLGGILERIDPDPWRQRVWAAFKDRLEHGESSLEALLDDPEWRDRDGSDQAWFGALLRSPLPERATQVFTHAVRLEPDLYWAHMHLGSRAFLNGRPEAAVRHFLAACVSDPDAPGAYTNLAAAYADINELGSAIEAGERAVDLRPENPRAQFNLARAYYYSCYADIASQDEEKLTVAKQRMRSALDHFEISATQCPDDVEGLLEWARALHHDKQAQRAKEVADTVLELAPDHGGAYLILGKILPDLGEEHRVVDTYLEGIRRAPGYTLLYLELGRELESRARIERARLYWRRAIQLGIDDEGYRTKTVNLVAWMESRLALLRNPSPRTPVDVMNRAMEFFRLGEYAMSVEIMTEFLDRHPSGPERRALLELSEWWEPWRVLELALESALRTAAGEGYVHEPEAALLESVDLPILRELGDPIPALVTSPGARTRLGDVIGTEDRVFLRAQARRWLVEIVEEIATQEDPQAGLETALSGLIVEGLLDEELRAETRAQLGAAAAARFQAFEDSLR